MPSQPCFGCQTRAGAREVEVTLFADRGGPTVRRLVRLCRYCREGGEFDWSPHGWDPDDDDPGAGVLVSA